MTGLGEVAPAETVGMTRGRDFWRLISPKTWRLVPRIRHFQPVTNPT
jgi:ABC-type arginine transport system permease subunit